MTEAQRRVLAALVDAGGAASTGEVAAVVGVHVTTARFHLERMAADGLVAVRPEPVDAAGARGRGRGRPRVQYVALTLPEGGSAGLGDAAQAVFEVSRALGFEPRLEIGDDNDLTEFTLTACPYRPDGGPVPESICRGHELLLQETANLAVAGAGTAAAADLATPPQVRLIPLATPTTCTLQLHPSA